MHDMSPVPLEERKQRFNNFIEQRVARGFKVISRSDTTAELHKPPTFPRVLTRSLTVFADVDDYGRIWVRKVEGD